MATSTATEATITLAAPITDADAGGGLFRVRIIDAGQGSSGIYPAETLQAAAGARVFAEGTHVYLDHPGMGEEIDRPERSVRDLAGVLASDAVYNETDRALDADMRIYSPYRQVVSEMADDIGMSIRALVEAEEGEWEGHQGMIMREIIEAASVDLVTRAGRGGKILSVLESARKRAVTEATASDRREQLDRLLTSEYGDEDRWVFVRDFDEETVWFEISSGDEAGTYQQAYTVTDDTATALTGDRTEVRAHTEYIPITDQDDGDSTPASESVPSRPAGQSTATPSREDTMAQTQIEESELATLRSDAGRATALESERDTAIQERDAARTERATAVREADQAAAARIVAEADYDFDTLQARGLLADLPTVEESGRLDTEAFTQTVAEEAARLGAETGAGQVHGLGTRAGSNAEDMSVEEMDTELARIAGHTVKEA